MGLKVQGFRLGAFGFRVRGLRFEPETLEPPPKKKKKRKPQALTPKPQVEASCFWALRSFALLEASGPVHKTDLAGTQHHHLCAIHLVI